jgi:hypothetical protein
VQLCGRHAVDVELARALEGRRLQVRGEEDAVEQLRAARLAAAALDDPLDLALDPKSGSRSCGSAGSVMTRVLLVAKISASGR